MAEHSPMYTTILTQWESLVVFCSKIYIFILVSYSSQGCIQKNFPGGGRKLGPHKQMTLAIMIIAYIYTSICLLRFAVFA